MWKVGIGHLNRGKGERLRVKIHKMNGQVGQWRDWSSSKDRIWRIEGKIPKSCSWIIRKSSFKKGEDAGVMQRQQCTAEIMHDTIMRIRKKNDQKRCMKNKAGMSRDKWAKGFNGKAVGCGKMLAAEDKGWGEDVG